MPSTQAARERKTELCNGPGREPLLAVGDWLDHHVVLLHFSANESCAKPSPALVYERARTSSRTDPPNAGAVDQEALALSSA